MPPGATPATKSRFEMLLGAKEHEMHHRAQLMTMQRMIGQVPHLTRQMQERMAQAPGAGAQAAAVTDQRGVGTAPRFRPEALTFLRALKRNNRREWFHRARRRVRRARPRADDRRSSNGWRSIFARSRRSSSQVRSVSLYRMYRDTRFSANKTPYKTHIAAHAFRSRGLPKHEGAGLYFHVAPDDVWIGGGMYAPQPPQLHAVREHIAANVSACARSSSRRRSAKAFGALEGEQLQRVPRGFPKDHEAAEFLKHRQFLAGVELPSGFATSPRILSAPDRVFRRVVPLVRFLNEPLVAGRG